MKPTPIRGRLDVGRGRVEHLEQELARRMTELEEIRRELQRVQGLLVRRAGRPR